jgi:hypothetical protein
VTSGKSRRTSVKAKGKGQNERQYPCASRHSEEATRRKF